jgi:hypothetical protein
LIEAVEQFSERHAIPLGDIMGDMPWERAEDHWLTPQLCEETGLS